ncbi:MAG: GDSL-type esterase/lipase family protein [Pirellulaceae bacterium]
MAVAQLGTVLPLGDSITATKSADWYTYRYELWKDFIDSDVDFEYVGSVRDSNQGFPSYQGQSFYPQFVSHEGHHGWTTAQIRSALPGWLTNYDSDVVLLHLGTNDALRNVSLSTTMQNLEQIIDLLQNDQPNTTIFIAQVLPTNRGADVNQRIQDLNRAIAVQAPSWSTATSAVMVVDQHTGFDPVAQTYDRLHPNRSGQEHLASRWHDAVYQWLEETGRIGQPPVEPPPPPVEPPLSERDEVLIRNNQTVTAVQWDGFDATDRGLGAFELSGPWSPFVYGDVDGDGKQDVVARNADGEWFVGNASQSQFVRWGRWSTAVDWEYLQLADLNGDGKDDLLGRVVQSGQWWAGLAGNDGLQNMLWGRWSTAVDWVDVLVGDVNGDGLDDVTGRVQQSGDWWTGVSSLDGFTNEKRGRWSNRVNWQDVRLADVDGNGAFDLVGRTDQWHEWWVGLSDSLQFTNQRWGRWDDADWGTPVVIDFDQDGNQDLVAVKRDVKEAYVLLADPIEAAFQTLELGRWATDSSLSFIAVGDVNGDQKNDIVTADSLNGTIDVLLADGTAWQAVSWPVSFSLVGTIQLDVGDVL